ncbi:MAG TPA: hypothetical protein VIY47_14425, partial [Ignavibacteriaceae bacterium]
MSCFAKEKEYMHQTGLISKKQLEDLEIEDGFNLDLIRCSKHEGESRSDVKHIPNFACLNYEVRQRGTFDRIVFAEGEFNHPSDLVI